MSSFFLYGVPGTGKTTLACSICEIKKIELIDVDGKAPHMYGLKKYFNAGKIIHRPIRSRLMEDDLKTRIAMMSKTKGGGGATILKQPKGYYEIMDIITAHEVAAAKGEKPEAQVLVLDSLTTAIEHYVRLFLWLAKKEAVTLPDFGIVLQHFEELFSALIGLQPNYFEHIIIICHERVDRDEATGRITSILPQIMGSMREKVGKNMMEYYRCIVDKGKYVVQTRTKDKDLFQANTVLPLDDVEEANLVKILAKGGEMYEKVNKGPGGGGVSGVGTIKPSPGKG